MADISIELIKQLRERTSAGVMDCRRALEAAGGDIERASQILAEQGLAAAAKKAHRVTAQGLVECYVHAGRIGAIVEVNCETDFVARTPDFQQLAHDIAMQVVASNPLVVTEDELPEAEIEEGGPDEPVLMLQAFIKDESKTIRQLVNEVISKTGENIQVRRFSRFELGS